MYEDVITLLTRDEAESLFCIEKLHCTLCHDHSILKATARSVRIARCINPTRPFAFLLIEMLQVSVALTISTHRASCQTTYGEVWSGFDGVAGATTGLRLRITAPMKMSAKDTISPVSSRGPTRIRSPNTMTPSKVATRGSVMVNPGWEAARDPALKEFDSNTKAINPTPIKTYGDQFVKTPSKPWLRCELNSLMTAATKPHVAPVAIPSAAARRSEMSVDDSPSRTQPRWR